MGFRQCFTDKQLSWAVREAVQGHDRYPPKKLDAAIHEASFARGCSCCVEAAS